MRTPTSFGQLIHRQLIPHNYSQSFKLPSEYAPINKNYVVKSSTKTIALNTKHCSSSSSYTTFIQRYIFLIVGSMVSGQLP